MGAPAGDDKEPKCQKHPVKRNIASRFVHEISKGHRNGEVGETDESVSRHVGLDESGVPQIAVDVR